MMRYFLSAVIGTLGAACCLAQGPGPVEILLLGQAPVDTPVIQLASVATVKGGSASARKAMEKLDVAELGEQTEISRDQIRFRLLLAGYEEKDFRVMGTKAVITKPKAVAPVEEPPTVKARDMVKAFVRVGSARMQMPAECLQDGRVGQVVRVRNLDTSKILQGKVTANGWVEIEY